MSSNPVEQIVRRVGHEWVVFIYEDGDEAIHSNKDVEELCTSLCEFFPYREPQTTNPLNIPGIRKQTIHCIASITTNMGTLVHSPMSKTVGKLNIAASKLADTPVFGLCAVLCQTEEQARDVEEEANQEIRKTSTGEKFMELVNYKAKSLWRQIKQKLG